MVLIPITNFPNFHQGNISVQKLPRPVLHLTYSKNGGNLGLVLNDKKWKFLHKII